MHLVAVSAALVGALLIGGTEGALKLSLERIHAPNTINKRQLSSRSNHLAAELANNLTDIMYTIQIAVGNPPQPQVVQLDTGSSDTWFLDSAARICHDQNETELHGGCFSVCRYNRYI